MQQRKSIFLGVLALLMGWCAKAQDLTGKWQWQIKASNKDLQSDYVLELDLKQEGNRIFGTRTLYLKNFDDVIIYMDGTIDSDGEVKLYSGKVVKFNLPDSILAAKQFSFVFQYDKNNKSSLIGIYTPKEDMEKIRLRNSDPYFYDLIYKAPSRSSFVKIADTLNTKFKQIITTQSLPTAPLKPAIETKVQHSLTIPAGDVKIDLYDNGTVDGDIVTLIVNDKVISEHQKLGLAPITMDIKKEDLKDTTMVIMKAENLGDIPPNTALMYITAAGKKYALSISSTLTTQAAVVLYKEK